MYFTTVAVAALAALASTAEAVGHAVIKNNCNRAIYVWSVGSTVSPVHTLKKGQSYSEVFRYDAKTGGIALKVCRSAEGLYDGSAQTNFAYTLDGNNIWYDISDVFGDAFSGKKVTVVPSVNTCPSIIWNTGIPPAGSQVHVCSANADVVMTTCA